MGRRGVIAAIVAALVVGGLVGYALHNASENDDASRPLRATSTVPERTTTTAAGNVATGNGQTIVSTGSIQVSGSLDQASKEDIAFYLATHEDTVDDIGPEDGVFVDPEGGRWAEVNGDSSCTFEVIDANGQTTSSGTGALIVIPDGQRALRTEPRCAWLHLKR